MKSNVTFQIYSKAGIYRLAQRRFRSSPVISDSCWSCCVRGDVVLVLSYQGCCNI